MTTYARVTQTCGVCGHDNEVRVLTSHYAHGGWADLDTRPPHLSSPILELQVQRCESCGYCATDLAEPPPEGSGETIEPESDQAGPDGLDVPEFALRYLWASRALENQSEQAQAGWLAMKAAWICDDIGHREAAIMARRRAYELFVGARKQGGRFAKSPAHEQIILVDVLRRSRRFEEARERCERALARPLPVRLRRILELESTLIESRDGERHSAREAFEEGAPSSGDSSQR